MDRCGAALVRSPVHRRFSRYVPRPPGGSDPAAGQLAGSRAGGARRLRGATRVHRGICRRGHVCHPRDAARSRRPGRGPLVEARDAFRQAHELGREPNPGLALLRLAEGDVPAAAAAIKRGLASARQPLPHSRLLPAHVTIALAAGDRAIAAAAAAELESIASTFGTAALKARALSARAAVTLAEGDAERAVREF